MNSSIIGLEDIINTGISGYHEYILDKPSCISFVSDNLCQMTGYLENEIVGSENDLFINMIHPADRDKYLAFIDKVSMQETSDSLLYRIIKKNGEIIYVKDSFTSKKSNGKMMGFSVLVDVSSEVEETENLNFFKEQIPCGFLRYTCEKQPKITYINQKLIDMLKLQEVVSGDDIKTELIGADVLLVVPIEERRRFSKYLNRVFMSDSPISGEMTLLCGDGNTLHVFGWITKIINEEGLPEYQSVCVDVTERFSRKYNNEKQRYLNAIAEVYDKIFEFNLEANTVKCIYCEDTSTFKRFENVAMQIDDALENWIITSCSTEDTDRVRNFFNDYCKKRLYEQGDTPPQVTYTAKSSDGTYKKYNGTFLKMDEKISFYGCRNVHESLEDANLKSENERLREDMKEIVMRFTDGLAAFELTAEGMVKPMYSSENVYGFFGFTEEEWMVLMNKESTIKEFIANSEASLGEFEALLRNGEAEFTYFDFKTEETKRIKAIVSRREMSLNASRYVMLYSLENKENEISVDNKNVTIRTFGYFDVFVGDVPIAFRNKKSKELLAILIDRKGGFVTSEEAINYLWEDEPVNTVTLSRYRKVALRLKNTLEEYGIVDIIESVDGKRRVVADKFRCDLYDYLSGKEEYSQLFKGSYLTNYSWSEVTLGELISERD